MNTVTQAAVAAAIGNFDGFAKNIELIRRETAGLYNALKDGGDEAGYTVRQSDTNFVWIKFDDVEKAKRVVASIRKDGISVRIMGANLRVTAGTPDECAEFISAFKKAVL